MKNEGFLFSQKSFESSKVCTLKKVCDTEATSMVDATKTNMISEGTKARWTRLFCYIDFYGFIHYYFDYFIQKTSNFQNIGDIPT